MPVKASIVISTYNRRASLYRTLQSLVHQTCPSDCFEVLLIDDGSTDDTASIAQMDWPFKLRYHYQINQGIAAARNWAVANCQTDYIIFLDDDITVNTDYIEAMLSPLRSGQALITMAILQSPVELSDTPFHNLYIRSFDGAESALSGVAPSTPIPFYECTGGVIAMRREAYLELGGTQELPQEGKTIWGGLDIAYRAHKAGFTFRRQTQSVAIHYNYAIRDLATYSQRMYKAGKYAVLLLQKYPELEQLVPLFCDRAWANWRQDSLNIALRKSWRSFMALDMVMGTMHQLVQLLEANKPNSATLRRLYIWIVSSSITRGIRAGIREFGPWEERP
jgi:glycosyltransferase involved in cell wall biosynthesis